MPRYKPKISSTFPLDFQVFDTVERMMYRVVQIHEGFPVIAERYVGSNKIQILLNEDSRDRYHVIQAIGLCDIEGQPVFEGDIMMAAKGPFHEILGIVGYEEGIMLVSLMDGEGTRVTLKDYVGASDGHFDVIDHVLLCEPPRYDNDEPPSPEELEK